MDKHFVAVIIAVGCLGALGIICGTVLICVMKDPLAGAACIGLGSNVVSGVFGLAISPKLQPTTITDIINQAAIDAVAKKGA